MDPFSPAAPRLTFKAWLRAARVTDSIAGDFILDARADRRMPDCTSLDQLRSYLGNCGACAEAIRVAPAIWRRYVRALRKAS